MLYVCTDITQFQTFLNDFQKKFDLRCIDLSKISSDKLAEEAEAIMYHHKDCTIFLGYVEPGWMLEPSHQTRLRKLFRKFPVGLVLQYVESLPYSWKNEIDTIYTFNHLKKHGESVSVDNGRAIHDQSKV